MVASIPGPQGYLFFHELSSLATVTYMLEGKGQHEDFAGHAGMYVSPNTADDNCMILTSVFLRIGAGDLQWMVAGKGIMHSEVSPSILPPGLTTCG